MYKLPVFRVTLLASILVITGNANAVTITNNYITSNSPTNFYAWDFFDREVREFDRTQPNWNQIGNMGDRLTPSLDNTILDIIDHASSIWESAIRDPFEIEITWRWGDLTDAQGDDEGSTLGVANFNSSTIVLNNQLDSWYLDIEPTTSEEFSLLIGNSVAWGHNSSVHVWDSSSLTLDNLNDLYTVAIHEIGHTLGLASSNPDYIDETHPSVWGWFNDYDIDITSPFPQEGLEIPMLESSAHIDHSDVLMNEDLTPFGVRDLITELDILAVAQISGWTDVYLPNFDHMTIDEWYLGTQARSEYTWTSVYGVPEPSTLLLMSIGMIGLGATRLRKKI